MPEPLDNGNDLNFLITRLERAAKRADDHWFPSNAELISTIQNGLREGDYDLDIEFLISELKTDFSLFTFCLKEALSLLRAEKCPVPEDPNPFVVLRTAGLARIKKILDKCEQRVSTHALLASSNAQQARLKEAMISASAAEVMAPFQSIDAEVGFSAALLKQLGMALIAWNYPSVYQHALERSDADLTLEQALNDALGFPPTVFGAYILNRWGISRDICAVIGEDPINGPRDPFTETQLYLKKICETGEALARASNPEYYPTAEADWDNARTTIETLIGPEGMQKVQQHVQKNCESYRALLPQFFADTLQLNPSMRIIASKEETLLEKNPYVKGCLPHIKKEFRDLYGSMNTETISQHSVRTLTQSIINKAGFSAGCVFVLDPAGKAFIPRLSIGKLELRTAGPVTYSDYSTRHDPVVSAFECNTPLIEHSGGGKPGGRACIAMALGRQQRIGVLYLEVPQSSLNDYNQNVMQHFKAVHRALEDSLHLS